MQTEGSEHKCDADCHCATRLTGKLDTTSPTNGQIATLLDTITAAAEYDVDGNPSVARLTPKAQKKWAQKVLYLSSDDKLRALAEKILKGNKHRSVQPVSKSDIRQERKRQRLARRLNRK